MSDTEKLLNKGWRDSQSLYSYEDHHVAECSTIENQETRRAGERERGTGMKNGVQLPYVKALRSVS